MGNNKSLPESSITGKWHWQSNQDPWNKNEALEWTAYSEKDNQLIEEAFLKKQDRVNLANHYILLSKRLQFNNQDAKKQRRVKRMHPTEHDLFQRQADRFCGELPCPKIINSPYGELENLRTFLRNKTGQSGFYLDPNIHCFGASNILIQEIRAEAKLLGQENKILKFEGDLQGVPDLNSLEAKEKFTTIILKAYTEDIFLYRRINELLRNEDWEKVWNLAGYIVCLIDIFLSGKFSPKPKLENNIEITESTESHNNLTLYRGTKLKHKDLKAYEFKETNIFSWNSVISTSTKREIAEKFYRQPKDDAVSVMFVIKAKIFKELEKNKMMIDISPYSVYRNEEEIILAPGTVFKLISKQKVGNIYEIMLEMMSDLDELRLQGVKFVGEMQANLYDGRDHSSLKHLNDNNLDEALRYIAKKKLRELSISFCEFSPVKIEQIFKFILNRNLRSLDISNLKISDDIAGIFSDYLPKTSLEYFVLCISGMQVTAENFRKILKSLPKCIRNVTIKGSKGCRDDEFAPEMEEVLCYLNILYLEIAKFKLSENSMKKMCQGKLRDFLSLTFKNCVFESNSLCYLLEKIPSTNIKFLVLDSNIYLNISSHYQSLNEDIPIEIPVMKTQKCKYQILCRDYSEETEIGFSNLTKALQFGLVQHLEIEFSISDDDSKVKVSQNELINLMEGINHISALEMFYFDVDSYTKFPEPIMDQIIELLKISRSLRGLCISSRISRKRMIILLDILKSYTKLESLILDRSGYSITDETSIAINDFLKSSQLQSLQFFLAESVISEEILVSLINNILAVISLRSLTLDLSRIKTFGSTHFESLSRGLDSLPNLQELKLDCSSTDFLKEDFFGLSNCLATLTNLTTLSLKFSSKVICNAEHSGLVESLTHLSSLISLELDFAFTNITEIDLEKAFSSVKNLKALKLKYIHTSLSEAQVIKLGHSLQLLKQLNTLKIELGDLYTRGGGKFEGFLSLASNRTDAKVLYLMFACSKNLSSSVMVKFCEAIKGTDHVEDIYVESERSDKRFLDFNQAISILESQQTSRFRLVMVSKGKANIANKLLP